LLFSRCLKPRGWATVPFMWDMSRSGRRLLAPTRLLSGTGSHSGSRRLRSSLHSCGALVAKPGLFSLHKILVPIVAMHAGQHASVVRWVGGDGPKPKVHTGSTPSPTPAVPTSSLAAALAASATAQAVSSPSLATVAGTVGDAAAGVRCAWGPAVSCGFNRHACTRKHV
jgi:hypothetical protein